MRQQLMRSGHDVTHAGYAQVFDNVVLGEWVHRQRKLQGDKRLPKEDVRTPA
jgi:hypothetical protein